MKSDVYYELRDIAAEAVVRAGGELYSRQIDAVLQAVAGRIEKIEARLDAIEHGAGKGDRS